MLVYAKEPRGIVNIDGYAIYGAYWGRSPVDLPHRLYKLFKEILADASYRPEYFKKHFGVEIPEIAFKVNELSFIPYLVVQDIAVALGLRKRNNTRNILEKKIIKALENVT